MLYFHPLLANLARRMTVIRAGAFLLLFVIGSIPFVAMSQSGGGGGGTGASGCGITASITSPASPNPANPGDTVTARVMATLTDPTLNAECALTSKSCGWTWSASRSDTADGTYSPLTPPSGSTVTVTPDGGVDSSGESSAEMQATNLGPGYWKISITATPSWTISPQTGCTDCNCGSCSASPVTLAVMFQVLKPFIDLDIDSNNNGDIAASNDDTEDVYEAQLPGKVIPVEKTATINLKTTYTAGTVTLTSTLTNDIASVSCGALPKTWTLGGGGSFPSSLTVTANSAPQPSQSGQLTLTVTTPDGITDSDTISLTVVQPVSKSPQNNRGAIWSPIFQFTGSFLAVGPNVESRTSVVGFDFNGRRYTDAGMVTAGVNTPISWSAFKNLGKYGMLVVATHGTRDPDGDGTADAPGIAAAFFTSRAALDSFIAPDTAGSDGVFAKEFRDEDGNTKGFTLSVSSQWVTSNWKADRDGARSIGFFMACHTADVIGGTTLIDCTGGAESFGYTWLCTGLMHVADTTRLLGRMNGTSDGAKLRPAGKAFDAGGYSNETVVNGAASGTTIFSRSTNGKYWVTLCPAPFVIANASGVTPSTGNKVGFAGFALDTERDTSIAPASVFVGGGSFSIPPYNLQQAWGVGVEWLLPMGGSMNMTADHTQVVGDGSTDLLFLDADRVAPNDADIPFNVSN